MNDTLFPLIISESLPLNKGLKALRNDQYTFSGDFPELETFLSQNKTVELTLPKKAKLLYLRGYILIIDFPKIDNVTITIYKERNNDALFKVMWNMSTDTYFHHCYSLEELNNQISNPFLYTNLAILNPKNANITDIFTKNILKTVRLFLYVLAYEQSIIRKENNMHVIHIQDLKKVLSVVRGHTKKGVKVAPYLRRHK